MFFRFVFLHLLYEVWQSKMYPFTFLIFSKSLTHHDSLSLYCSFKKNLTLMNYYFYISFALYSFLSVALLPPALSVVLNSKGIEADEVTVDFLFPTQFQLKHFMERRGQAATTAHGSRLAVKPLIHKDISIPLFSQRLLLYLCFRCF